MFAVNLFILYGHRPCTGTLIQHWPLSMFSCCLMSSDVGRNRRVRPSKMALLTSYSINSCISSSATKINVFVFRLVLVIYVERTFHTFYSSLMPLCYVYSQERRVCGAYNYRSFTLCWNVRCKSLLFARTLTHLAERTRKLCQCSAHSTARSKGSVTDWVYPSDWMRKFRNDWIGSRWFPIAGGGS